MKRLLLLPVAVLAAWIYWRHQRKSAEQRLQVSRTWMGRGMWFWRDMSRRVEKNIALLFPEISESKVKEYSREVVHTVGANLAFALGSWHETIGDVEHRIKIGPGLHELKKKFTAGEKIVVVVDHVAPFDGAAAVVEILDIQAGIVVERLQPILYAFFNKSRKSWKGVHLIPAERGATYQKAAEFIEKERLVAVFIDIFRPRDKADVVCRFGAVELGVSSLPVRLAYEHNATIYTMLPIWKDGVICLDAVEFELYFTGDMEWDIKNETARLIHERIEPHVTDNVGHWMRPFSDDFSRIAEVVKASD